LVSGKIVLHPTEAGGLIAEVQGHYDGLIELVKENPGGKAGASKVRMVAGAGFEPTTFRL
jgi:site-specific DNA recombinase